MPVAGSAGPELNYWSTSAARTEATYGGIAVLISKLEDTEKEVPVYYYIYDENNNFVELKQEIHSFNRLRYPPLLMNLFLLQIVS